MRKKIDAKIVDKNKSVLMRFIAWFLNTFGIMTRERFMKYTTTIRLTIYAPKAKCEPVTLKHELVHVRQWFAHPFYPLRYLLSSRSRARWEVEAYLESQPGLGLSKLIKILAPYRCSQKEVEAGWDWYKLKKGLDENG